MSEKQNMDKGIEGKIVLFSLWLLMFSSSSQFFILSPILSQIGEQLNIQESLRGTLITAYALTLGIVALITGPISDRIGRRKILLIGSGAMAISLLMHSFAYDYWSMLLLRIAAGFAGGILTGSCVAYIGDYFVKNKRGYANGLIATGSAAGQIFGIPAGTLLAGMVGFYAPFQFFGLVMVFAFVLILWKLPQPNLSITCKKMTLIETAKDYWLILKKPAVKTVALGYLLLFLSITVFVVYFPTWLENSFQFSSAEIAFLFFTGGIATVLTGPIIGKLSDRLGRKQIIITANLLLAIMMPLTVYLLNFNHHMYYIVFFIIMVLVVARMVPFQVMAAEVVPDHERGRIMSLTISIGQLGMAIGSAISGIIYTEIGFIGNATLAAVAAFAMATLIQVYIKEPVPALEVETVEA